MGVLAHLNVVIRAVGIVDVVHFGVAVIVMVLHVKRSMVFHHVFVGEFVGDVLELEGSEELEVCLLDLVDDLLQLLLQVLLPQLLLGFHGGLLVASHLVYLSTNIINLEENNAGQLFF